MDERAWNGEDVTVSATALSQAVDAMAESVENYIRANAVPDVTGENTESQTQEPTDADMNYIFDLSDQFSYEEWAELEARASDISQVFTLRLWMTSRSTAAETTYIKPPISSTTPVSSAWAQTGTVLSSC